MAKIKFDHAVIYNGVFYSANTEIEVKEPKTKKETEKEAVMENDKRTSRSSKSRITE